MPYFTIFAVIFILVFTVKNRKGQQKQDTATEEFWNRELLANTVRKQDISNLNYINIPLEIFPLDMCLECEEKIRALSGKKILNLTGFTNTDLKLAYGVANLEALSEYDANFSDLVYCIGVYATELLKAGRAAEAKKILEYAVEIQADSALIYTSLAGLYSEDGEPEKIGELAKAAERLNSLSKQTILAKLSEYSHTMP